MVGLFFLNSILTMVVTTQGQGAAAAEVEEVARAEEAVEDMIMGSQ